MTSRRQSGHDHVSSASGRSEEAWTTLTPIVRAAPDMVADAMGATVAALVAVITELNT
jgi:hypothetical protein